MHRHGWVLAGSLPLQLGKYSNTLPMSGGGPAAQWAGLLHSRHKRALHLGYCETWPEYAGLLMKVAKCVTRARILLCKGPGSVGSGGGIYNSGAMILNENVTSGNTANTGGGIYNDAGVLTVQNSIVAGNTSNQNNGQDCAGDVSSSGYNLIGIPQAARLHLPLAT